MTRRRGRQVARRLRVRGWLRTLSPLHVGGVGEGTNGPLTVAIDGLGRPYVPGTSLAGALLAAASRLPGADRARLRSLWGWMEPNEQDGAASRVVVRDALIAEGTAVDESGMPAEPLDLARLETRFSVGIDRVTGAAAHGFLHGRVVVPRGAYLRFELDVESPAGVDMAADTDANGDADADAEQLRALLGALYQGHVRLGAAKTRGLGRIGLLVEQTTVYEERLDSAAGLVAALGRGGSGPRDNWDLRGLAATPSAPAITVRVDWRPRAPLMVRAAVDGVDIKSIPHTEAVGSGQVALVLPGSSLKGRLRAQAERIERTVRRRDVESSATADGPAERSAAFRRQLDESAAVRALFGAAPVARDRGRTAGAAEADPSPGPGSGSGSGSGSDARGAAALSVDDCCSTSPVPEEIWNTLHGAPAPEGEVDGDSAPDPASDLRQRGFARADHVAIDRWTGGAAEGRLFSVLEPHGIDWEPITLTVDPARLTAHGTAGTAALPLLLLVLRDLQCGRIPLGWGTNRGMGDIAVDAITLTFPDREEPLSLNEYLDGPDAAGLTEQWCRYLDGSPV